MKYICQKIWWDGQKWIRQASNASDGSPISYRGCNSREMDNGRQLSRPVVAKHKNAPRRSLHCNQRPLREMASFTTLGLEPQAFVK